MCDCREYESLHAMAANPLRSVHVHPVQQHYFVVAESRYQTTLLNQTVSVNFHQIMINMMFHKLLSKCLSYYTFSFANIYDLRHLKRRNNQAVCELSGHSRSVSSAFFSPLTGNRVLTTCMDDTIRCSQISSITARSASCKCTNRGCQSIMAITIFDVSEQIEQALYSLYVCMFSPYYLYSYKLYKAIYYKIVFQEL